MSNDEFFKKIEELEVNDNFEKINSSIDYSKYTKKKQSSFNFKFAFLPLAVAVIIAIILPISLMLNNIQNESGFNNDYASGDASMNDNVDESVEGGDSSDDNMGEMAPGMGEDDTSSGALSFEYKGVVYKCINQYFNGGELIGNIKSDDFNIAGVSYILYEHSSNEDYLVLFDGIYYYLMEMVEGGE